MKKEIYLPIFTGFYNTIHDFDEDYLLEDFREENKNLCKGKTMSEIQALYDEKYNIDYKEYREDYSKEYVEAFKEKYLEKLKSIGFSDFKYTN